MDLADYLRTPAVQRRGAAELSLPVVHIESLDAATVSWCRDWRAEIRMTDLAAGAAAAPVTVGAVDFVLVQLSEGYRPVAEHLAMLGVREARFGELFEGGQIEPDLDEHDEFCDSMPMFTVLLVVEAIVDDLMPRSRLRPWSVAEVIQTMLPTHSGMVAASALGGTEPARRLVSTRRLDPDLLDVGLTGIPGHPGLLGRATLFTYLDDAHTALRDVADEVFTVHR
ncbi:MAG: hypothetical protein WBO08_17925 [Mycobacterium sp.]|nr:hypothetical protein [Mycobacterium sp.]